MIIFIYICDLLARKLNKTYRTAAFSDQRRFEKYRSVVRGKREEGGKSRRFVQPVDSLDADSSAGLRNSLLSLHVEHETAADSVVDSHSSDRAHHRLVPSSQSIASSIDRSRSFVVFLFQGIIVALIYTLVNSEVQREILRSFDRCLMRHHGGWQQPNFFRHYMSKLENDRLYSLGYQARSMPTPIRYRPTTHFTGIVQYYRCTNQHKYSVSNPSRKDSTKTAAALAQELALMNPTADRQ